MKSIKVLLLAFFLAQSFAQTKPQITVSPAKVQHRSHVDLRGSGFTPSSNVNSHLRRSDGTEFPVLPMQTNDRGEIYHDIDTLILEPGIHEVWIIDERSKVSSNIARFEVTLDSP